MKRGNHRVSIYNSDLMTVKTPPPPYPNGSHLQPIFFNTEGGLFIIIAGKKIFTKMSLYVKYGNPRFSQEIDLMRT